MWLQWVLDFLFPGRCAGCATVLANGETLCKHCFVSVPLHRSLRCGACRARLPNGKKICHLAFPYILGAATDYNYPPVRRLICDLKFRGLRPAVSSLAHLLAIYAEGLPLPTLHTFVVVPIPLNPARQRERGFNQAELIAAELAHKLGLALSREVLKRTDSAPPQSTLADRADRRRNVAGCFRAARPAAVRGMDILLIDDVVTSGATLQEAANTLKNAGARQIIALTVARA